MHRIKMVTLACVAALAVLAVSASAASAREVYQADGTTIAANGTTFAASGPVTLRNSYLTNNCTQSVNGKITNNGVNGAALTAGLTGVEFTGCNYPTSANTRTWTLTLPQTGNPGTVTGVDVSVLAFGTTCKYRTDATRIVNGSWTNGSPSKVTLSGTVALYSGSAFLCGSTGSVSGTMNVTDSSTPGDNLLILPAP